jgi:predicted AlkP superfamily phosphohydrolase/phosphomutase
MSQPQRVIGIALDALSHPVLEQWMEDGTLPNLAGLRRQGAYGRLQNPGALLYENSWLNFLHSQLADVSGQWGHQHLDSRNYILAEMPGFDLSVMHPFYARPPHPRTAIFDLPLTPLVDGVNGIQVLGWGTEENQCLRVSSPASLLDELRLKHGEFPLFEGGGARVISSDDSIVSFRNPSLYDTPALARLKDQLLEGIRRRTAIMADLLAREPWDLFLGAYAEGHLAGHLLWHTDLPHPLCPQAGASGWLRDVYVALDRSIGDLVAALPDDTLLVLFAVHGMKPNGTDLDALLFLPEALYRWQFGKAALADSSPDTPLDPLPLHYRAHWKDEVWQLATPQGLRDLASPHQLHAENDPQDWNPLRWYAPVWPQMRAYALHSYSHGMVRLNVRGRDGNGIVAPEAYKTVCAEVAELIESLRCARTGLPLARRAWRTRENAFEEGPHLPPADLMVEWTDNVTDVVDGPGIGRIGPVPFFRSGGHGPRGFCLMRGPGIAPGSSLPENMQVTELTAMLMRRLGMEPAQA